jgi:short-subunit dehydrogenase
MRDIALVTGASTGIGADLARILAREGHDLALVARSADKLNALADEIAQTGRPKPLVIPADLSDPKAGDDIAAALAAAGARVKILVNNAGYGLLGHAETLDRREQLGIVDVNVRALLDLTLRFLPDLRAARGKILNVGSIVSFMAGPGMAVYYASKAFVSSFSRALSEELKGTGVTVTVVHPGLTKTEFQERAGFNKTPRLAGLAGATSMSVAEEGYRAMMAGRRAVVTGLGNKISTFFLPLMPDAIVLPLVNRIQTGRN